MTFLCADRTKWARGEFSFFNLVVFAKRSQRRADVVILGVALGLLVLSRQWGFLLFPPLILFVGVLGLKDAQNRRPLLKALFGSLLISLIIGGWFYINLLSKYGGVTAFNREPSAEFALSNQPKEFYFGLGSGKLFTDPYTLHVFPFLALLTGNLLDSLRQRSHVAYRIAVASLGIVLIPNLGAVFTRYTPW